MAANVPQEMYREERLTASLTWPGNRGWVTASRIGAASTNRNVRQNSKLQHGRNFMYSS